MSETPDNLTTTIPPHPGTRWQPTTKAEAGADDKRSSGGRGYNARAGEVIAGNLARGGDGKFTSAGNATPAKPKPTTGRRAVDLLRRAQPPKKGRAKPKPKKGPKGPDPAKAREREQRRREAEARRAQREQEKLDRAVDADKLKRQQLADREARADAQKKRRAEVMARRAQREMDKLKRQQQPKGGGGGGSAKKPKPAEGDQDAAKLAERTANRAKVGAILGQDLDPLASLADGAQPDATTAEGLVKAGLATRQADGTYTTTASGRSVLRAAERGDERQARAFLQRAGELRTNADTRTVARTARQAERDRKRLERANRPKAGGGKYKSFAVYKDHATGRLRWIAVSSTAFKDRDGEIVTVAALQKDVARSDASGRYGPLRWWHVPGLDIGDCDFRAVHGRSLIESGMFRDDRYAAAIKAQDEVSLGFLHAIPVDPIFDDIHTFERSVVPFPEGRGSNLFTRLVVKEVQMLTEAKKAALASRVGPDILAELLAQVEATEKAADQAGVAYKSAQRVAVWDEASASWLEVVAKAAPPVDALPDEIPAVDAKAEGDMAMGEEVIEEPVDEGRVFVGDMSPDEFMGLLQSGIAAALAPLTEALNIEAKMRGVIDEVKSTVSAYTTQKDATEAERLAQIEALKAETATLKAAQDQAAAKLSELLGDQPRAAGFRASQSETTVIDAAHALKNAQPQSDPAHIQFFGFDPSAVAAQ